MVGSSRVSSTILLMSIQRQNLFPVPRLYPSSVWDLAIGDSWNRARRSGVDIGSVVRAGERQPPPGISKKLRASR